MAALALVLGLQSVSAQASQVNPSPESAATTLAMNALDENHGLATQPMGGKLAARDGEINIRKQPTVESPILSQGYNQDPLYIFKSALNPQGDRWYFVENIPAGEQGWVHGDYVRLNEPGKRFPNAPTGVLNIGPTGMVDWDRPHAVEEQPERGMIMAQDVGAWVNVRSQPSTNSTVLHQALRGDSIYIYNAATFSSPPGEAQVTSLWYFVAFLDSGAEGWVHSDFVASAWESDEPFEVSGFSPRPGQLQRNGQDNQIQLYQSMSRRENAVTTGQGSPGEAVTLLNKLETPRGRVWYRVRLAGGQEGWVPGANVVESVTGQI